MISTGGQYRSRMDPTLYLKDYESVSEWQAQPLRELHKLFQSYQPQSGKPIKFLDFGAGPILGYSASAAAVADEVVFAEFAEQNREALQKWLNKECDAHNWTPYFKYVVEELEGKSEQEAIERQERLRAIVKAVVTCDIKDNPPIQSGYEGPYDVIFSSLCLVSCCATPREYIEGVCKLTRLLKPGGMIALNSVSGNGPTHFYMVGDEKFIAMNSSPELLTKALKEGGCHGISIKIQPRQESELYLTEEFTDFTATLFAMATKKA